MEREGPKRQPQGFVHTEVLAMLLDPRFRDMKGVPLEEHEECWALLEKYLTALIQEQQEEAQRAAAGAAGGRGCRPGAGRAAAATR